MKIYDQVVSLEPAKQMREMGAEQNSIFFWNEWYTDDERDETYFVSCDHEAQAHTIASAYTVAELGEMLPRGHWESGAVALDTLFFCSWEEDWERPNEKTSIVKYGKTEADARAEMWLHLKKDGLI